MIRAITCQDAFVEESGLYFNESDAPHDGFEVVLADVVKLDVCSFPFFSTR